MFSRHRNDLKEAHAAEVAALKMAIQVLADQIDWLRYQLAKEPYIAPSTPAANPTGQPETDPGVRAYLSEEEEEALALHLNGHINEQELRSIQEELGLRHLEAVPD